MRGFGGWLTRMAVGAALLTAVASLATALVVTAPGAAVAWVRDHPWMARGPAVVLAVLFALTWPRFRRRAWRRAWRTATETRLTLAEQQDRSRLIDAIRAWRVEQSLDVSLRRVARLQVGLQHDPSLVQAEFCTDFTSPWVELSVLEAFERARGRLLITGEPGSGKTTLALELLGHLLERARVEPTAGVPELFPLASWGQRPRPLLVWLEDELRRRGFGPRWIREGRLIPILDGLDEVDEDHRASCLEVINDFRDYYEGRPLVVTCRLAEYRRLVAEHPALAFGAGYVTQPLPPARISEYLDAAASANPAWGEVRDAIARGEADELCRLWRTPLMLTVTVRAYMHGDVRELLDTRSPTERVWAVFVEATQSGSIDPRHRDHTYPDVTPVPTVKRRYIRYKLPDVRRWLVEARLGVARLSTLAGLLLTVAAGVVLLIRLPSALYGNIDNNSARDITEVGTRIGLSALVLTISGIVIDRARRRWWLWAATLLGGVIGLVGVVLLIWLVPPMLYGHLSGKDRASAEATTRTGFIAGLAGLAALGSLVLPGRTYRLTEQGQITDRYTKAIAQLADKELEVRLGGIYALERIAIDSRRDHPTVVEVLSAFVRERTDPSTPRSPR